MFDKELLKLIGGNKKYVVYTVLLMVLGMLANIGITASICWAVYFLIEGYEPLAYIYPAITAVGFPAPLSNPQPPEPLSHPALVSRF